MNMTVVVRLLVNKLSTLPTVDREFAPRSLYVSMV